MQVTDKMARHFANNAVRILSGLKNDLDTDDTFQDWWDRLDPKIHESFKQEMVYECAGIFGSLWNDTDGSK
jgi:hypothetical protein